MTRPITGSETRLTPQESPEEAVLDDLESRVNSILLHSQQIEQGAYAFDRSREQLVDKCADTVGDSYTFIAERIGGACKALIYGDQNKAKEA